MRSITPSRGVKGGVAWIRRLQLLCAVLSLLGLAGVARAQTSPAAITLQFFQSVASKDYGTSWALLSKKTQDDLVSLMSAQLKVDPDTVREAFRTNDPKAQSLFWEDFRTSSHADRYAILKFEDTARNGKTASVKVQGVPVVFQMFDQGGWKFGLEETFFPSGFGQDANKG